MGGASPVENEGRRVQGLRRVGNSPGPQEAECEVCVHWCDEGTQCTQRIITDRELRK